MRDAIQDLAEVLEVRELSAGTHRTVIVSGWNNDASTVQAIAKYLVGLRACAIDAALTIRARLEDTEEDQLEVLDNVLAIVREDNSELTAQQKTNVRNPWIAEGLWHLCMTIAARYRPELHVTGTVVALNYAHPVASDHGLDVAAIYQSDPGGLFGLSFVESKAKKLNVNGAISEAVGYFREVNEGKKHGARIRQTVQIMRTSLPGNQQALIPSSFWKRTRAYIPNPHHCLSLEVDWTNSRPSLATLRVSGIDIDVVVMPHAIEGYDEFFDIIADEMRAFARSLG